MTNDIHRPIHHFHVPVARSIVFIAQRVDAAGSSASTAGELVAVVHGRRPHPEDEAIGDEMPQFGTVLAKLHLGPGMAMACEEVAVELAGFTDYDVVIEPGAAADASPTVGAAIRVDLVVKS